MDESSLDEVQRQALGDGDKRPLDIEADLRQVARSSVTAAVAIPAGTAIERRMLAVKRPAGGVTPGEMDSLTGCVATVDIPADTAITARMLTRPPAAPSPRHPSQ